MKTHTKKIRTLGKLLILLGLIFLSYAGYSQAGTAVFMEVKNMVQLNASTFQYDVFGTNTGNTSFAIRGYSFGLNCNQALANGGILSHSFISRDASLATLPTVNAAISAPHLRGSTANAVLGNEVSMPSGVPIRLATMTVSTTTTWAANTNPFINLASATPALAVIQVTPATGKTQCLVTVLITPPGTSYVLQGTTNTGTATNLSVLTAAMTPSPTGANPFVLNSCSNTSSTTTASACDSYTWAVNGNTYTVSGSYTFTTLIGSGPCIDTKTLNLTINHSTILSSSVTACNSYTWSCNGVTYTTSGTYTCTSLNAQGCVNTATLNLTINYNTTTGSLSATACNSYTWAAPTGTGNTYTVTGMYTKTTTNANGCVNTATLNLIINNSTTSSSSVTACNSYTWSCNGVTYTTSGTYTCTSLNAQGCVNTATLNLTINYNTTTGSLSATACNSYTWAAPTGTGNTYTVTGMYTKTTTNANGCVNTATLNLIINNSTTSSSSVTACNSYTWSCNGVTYTASGTYTCTSLNAQGCVNTATLILTILNGINASTSVTKCYSYTWPTNGLTYTVSGVYTSTTMNANGCVNTTTLNLTIAISSIVIANVMTPVSCNSTNNGSINITASAGSPPYSYFWNDSVTTQNRTSLQIGEYGITVTDNNGCTKSDTILVTNILHIIISDSVVQVSTPGGNNGALYIYGMNGTAPYSYSNNGGTTFQSSNVFSNLAENSYSVVVHDVNGCSALLDINVSTKTQVSSSDPNNPIVYVSQAMMNAISAWTDTIGIPLDTYLAAYPGMVPADLVAFWSDFNSGQIWTVPCRCRPVRTKESITKTPYYVNQLPSGYFDREINDGAAIYSDLEIDRNCYGPFCADNRTLSTPNSGFAKASIINLCLDSLNYKTNCCPQTLCVKAEYDARVHSEISFPHSIGTDYATASSDCSASLIGTKKSGNGGITTVTNLTKSASVFDSETSQDYSNGMIDIDDSILHLVPTANVGCFQMNSNELFTFTLSSNSNVSVHGHGKHYRVEAMVYSNYLLAFAISQNTNPNCCLKETADWSMASLGSPGSLGGGAPKTTSTLKSEVSAFLNQAIYTIYGPWILNVAPYTTVNVSTSGIADAGVVIGSQNCALQVSLQNLKRPCYNDPNNGCITIDGYGGTPLPPLNPCLGNHYNCQITGHPSCYSGPIGPFCTPHTFCGLCAGSYTIVVSDAFGYTSTTILNLTASPQLGFNNVVVNSTLCNGSMGSITVNVSGGNTPYQYSLNSSTYQTSNAYSNLAAGTYTINVKDANGCVSTSTAIVTGDPVCDIYCDHYTANNEAGWSTIYNNNPVTNSSTTPINITSGVVNFVNVPGATDDRIYHAIPTLPDNSWVVDFDFKPISGSNVGVAASLVCLTAGNLTPYLSTVVPPVYTSQDFIEVNIQSPHNGPNYFTTTTVQAAYKDGNAVPIQGPPIPIPDYTTVKTNYYGRLERINTTTVLLSIFSSSTRIPSSQIAGSPVVFCIPSTVMGLNTLQHSNMNQADQNRRFSGTVDNVCIKHGPNTSCPFVTDFYFAPGDRCAGSGITAATQMPSANTGATLVNDWIFVETDANCNELAVQPSNLPPPFYGNNLSMNLDPTKFLQCHHYALKHGIYSNCLPWCDTKKCFTIACPTYTVSASGSGSYTWNTNGITYTATGTYTYTNTNIGGCTTVNTLNLIITPGSTLNLTAFIEGFMSGVNTMTPVLSNEGVSASATACDSITVELHNATTFVMEYSANAILNQNGTATCIFPAVSGNKYIVIKHRNALETWSANPVSFSAATTSYNFSTAASKAYGSNQTQVSPGIWALYSGDIVRDQNIDLLDMGILEPDIDNYVYGYVPTDINGDGNVDLLDAPYIENNTSNFIFSVHP